VETEYLNQFSKDSPLPGAKSPMPWSWERKSTRCPNRSNRAGKVTLYPLQVPMNSPVVWSIPFSTQVRYHEVYFDETIPAMKYQLTASFIDLKNTQTYQK